MFSDRELSGVIVLLIVIDVLVVSLWIGVDTLEIITKTLDSQVSTNRRSVTKFSSENDWKFIEIGHEKKEITDKNAASIFLSWITTRRMISNN